MFKSVQDAETVSSALEKPENPAEEALAGYFCLEHPL